MNVYDQDIIIEQIVTFLDGRANRDEVSSLQVWMAQSEQHWTFFTQIKSMSNLENRSIMYGTLKTIRNGEAIII